MPRGNGTGPNGMGPMTGRAAGYCAGYNVAGFANKFSNGSFERNPECGPRGGGGGWKHRHLRRQTEQTNSWQGSCEEQADREYQTTRTGLEFSKEQELNAMKQQANQYERLLSNLLQRINKIESTTAATNQNEK